MADKKLTPMMELIEEINKTNYNSKNVFINMANELLEKERQMVIETHIEIVKRGIIEEGVRKWNNGYYPLVKKLAEQYYSETFKTK